MTPEMHERSNAGRERRRRNALRGDGDLVAKLGTILPTNPSRKEILKALNCSNDKLQRLLRDHFADDPMAEPYRAVARGEHDAEVLARYKELRASMSHQDACQALHVGPQRAMQLVKEHGLISEGETVKAIRDGIAEGLGLRDIAWRLHTHSTVIKKLMGSHNIALPA